MRLRFDLGPDGSKTGELIEQLRGLAATGIETVIGDMPDADRITPIEIVGREVSRPSPTLDSPDQTIPTITQGRKS